MSTSLAELKSRIDWVIDALIPADPKGIMPSGRDISLADRLLPQALKQRDDMALAFLAAVARLPEERPDAALAAIQALGPEAFQVVTFLIAGAYFLDETVNHALHYPGQEAVFENADYDEIMDVVGRVMERGPVFLDVQG